MNRSLDIIKEIYRPTKYTIIGKSHILETTSGHFVVKEKKGDIRGLYGYLESRNFNAFPPLVDDSREGVNIYQYVEDADIPKEQKATDFIKIVALLHEKTSYYKEVTEDTWQSIYDNVKDMIEYQDYFYQSLYQEYFTKVFPSPSEYLLLTNISKILEALKFSKSELEVWLSKVKDLKKVRLCQINNHLSMDHFRSKKDSYIINWDYSCKDTPVMDIYKFYKNNYFDYSFETLLETYFKICPWNEEEKKLFFVVISIPPKFDVKGSEFTKVKNIRKVLDYVYKTEELIRPYYTEEKEEEQADLN